MSKIKIALFLAADVPEDQYDLLDHVEVFRHATPEEGNELARHVEQNGLAEAIVAPATAVQSIARNVSLPVIRCDPNDFDILKALLQAEATTGFRGEKIALILHNSRLKVIDANQFKPYLHNDLYLFTYNDEKDIASLVNEMSVQGFRIIVGGLRSLRYLGKLGIFSTTLRLGREPLRLALDTAREIVRITKQSREKGQRLTTALNLFPDGVLVLDGNGVVTECNEKAASIFGIGKTELVGANIEDVTRDPSWSEVYREGKHYVDHFVEMEQGKFFTTRQPIVYNFQVGGAVATFQEVVQIEKLEQKYRKVQLHGLVAKYTFEHIVGVSTAMRATVDKAKAFSRTESFILIEGETGTGKELFAQSIHNSSARAKESFVAINCAALPENLLESELMGYEEGAFSGAKRGGKQGLFELAHNGTIFLDEINRLPLHLQSRILRVLQEKQVLRVGGDRVIPVNVRVIAATNQNLRAMVNQKLFQEDLYYRLRVLDIKIPPLREHMEDLPHLVHHFLESFQNKYGRATPFTEAAIRLLQSHSWPGNIRELLNCLEKYVVVNSQLGTKDVVFVAEYLRTEHEGPRLAVIFGGDAALRVTEGSLKDMERQIIDQMLAQYGNNRSEVAKALGVSRTTLWKKLQDNTQGLP